MANLKKIKVTHIITGLRTGGAEMMLYKLLSAYDRGQFEMSVISLSDVGVISENIKHLGVRVYPLNIRKNLLGLLSLCKLTKIIKQENPDILQGWMYHGNLMATIAGKLNNKKISVMWNIRQTLYSLKREKILTALVIKLCAWLSKLPNYIIYNSNVSILHHQKIGYFQRQIKMIPNGFDCELLKPGVGRLRSELNLSENNVLIGLVARYHPMKCHQDFIEAVTKLDKDSSVKFILVGCGIDKDNKKLIQDINASGMADSFYLLGERSDVVNIFSSLDIAALTSGWGEGFPNVVGEAMACGIPCVVTNIGDAAKIVADTGVVVAPNDIAAITNGLQHLINIGAESRKALGHKARERIKSNFSIDAVIDQYQYLYKKLRR